jgi:hypothetical protein
MAHRRQKCSINNNINLSMKLATRLKHKNIEFYFLINILMFVQRGKIFIAYQKAIKDFREVELLINDRAD